MDQQNQPSGMESASPVMKKHTIPEGMSFPEAMQQVIEGKKISRMEWGNEDEYCLLNGQWLMIHIRGEFHTWQINDGDILAKDWITL